MEWVKSNLWEVILGIATILGTIFALIQILQSRKENASKKDEQPVSNNKNINKLGERMVTQTPSLSKLLSNKTNDDNPIVGGLFSEKGKYLGAFSLPLFSEGNIVLFGRDEEETILCLRNAVFSLINCTPPSKLNIYILSKNVSSFSVFSATPHLGLVVDMHSNDHTSRFLNFVQSIYKERVSKNEEDIKSYPKAVFIINDTNALFDSYYEWAEILLPILRDGKKYGLFFLLTSSSTKQPFPSRITDYISRYIYLNMQQSHCYSDYGPLNKTCFPVEVKGNGVFVSDAAYRFQLSRISDRIDDSSAIEEVCNKANSSTNKHSCHVTQIQLMPDIVSSNMLSRTYGLSNIPVGINDADLSETTWNVIDAPVSFITSAFMPTSINFRTAFCYSLSQIDGITVTIIDANSDGLRLEHGSIKIINSRSDFDNTINSLFDICTERHKQFNENKFVQFTPMAIVINGFKELLRVLGPDEKVKLKDLLSHIIPEWNCSIIVCDTGKDLCDSFRDYLDHANGNNGRAVIDNYIWIGPGISDYYRFSVNTNGTPSRTFNNISEEYGIVALRGHNVIAKMIRNQ